MGPFPTPVSFLLRVVGRLGFGLAWGWLLFSSRAFFVVGRNVK